MPKRKLSFWEKAGFGVCDMGGNLFFTAMGFWSLNYLTDTIGLAAAAAGVAVMIGKVWDAVTDPMMGYVSDRTRSRWGRRRPYLLFGAVPLLLSMWYFFTNPHLTGQTAMFVWATLALCFLNTAYTVVSIPYSSLTPELTSDYNERTSLNGFRFAFAGVGTMLGAAIVLPIVKLFPDQSTGFSVAGLSMGVIMLASALITFFSVKEPMHENSELPSEGFFSTYLSVFRNKAYVVVLVTYALNILAINFLQGILVYYFKYVFHAEAMTTIAMVILLAVTLIFIPVSVPVSKRIGKRQTYQLGLAIIASICVLLYFTAHRFGLGFFFAMMLVAGVGLGLAYVAPWAMVPDTVEWDAASTGERREGAYYGMWTFTSKCGQALSIVVSGFVLQWGGYVADAEQSASSIAAIRTLIGPLPAVVFAGAIALLFAYPITEKLYNEMMARKQN